jgi:hypothetical protein
MTPVTKEAGLLNTSSIKAAKGIGKVAVAADDAVPNLADLVEEMFSAATALDAATGRADKFRDTVTTLRAPQEDLRSATRDVWTELDNMSQSLDDNGATLEANTEEGRANQEQLETTRDAIYGHAAALLENGASAETAAADIAANVLQLDDQWRAAGATEGQIAALNAEYGLTPEQISTYLEVLGDKVAHAKIGAYTTDLKEIPLSVSTTVTAKADTGGAYTKIANLSAPRDVAITPYLTKSELYVSIKASGSAIMHSAAGRFVSGPMLSTLGESGPEVVLPLNRPGRLSALLAMPEVGPRVAAAFGGSGGGTSSGSGGASVVYQTVNATVNMPPGANGDDVVRALRKWQRQSGPLPLAVR